MDIKRIQELEEFEKLVWRLHGGYYCPAYPHDRNFAFEKSIDDKVLYYLKLGLTCKDLEFKIAERDRRKRQAEDERKRAELKS